MNTIIIDAINRKLAEYYPQGCAIEYHVQFHPAYVLHGKVVPRETIRYFSLWVKDLVSEEFDTFGKLLKMVEDLTGETIKEIIVEEKSSPRWN